MSNLTLNQEENGTLFGCGETIDLVHGVLNTILLFFSFPATFVVIVILLRRFYKASSFSSAEIFLLQINLTNVCLFVFNLLLFLEGFNFNPLSYVIYDVFFSATITARPVFLLAICVILYLAIAHPVTYMTVKTYRHWEWLVITLGWLYALAIIAVIIFTDFNIFVSIYAVLLYNVVLPSMFFNIATLRALVSSGPEGNGQTLNPAKRKAFRIILGILLSLLLYYIPRICFLVYPYVAKEDGERFLCMEGSALMFLPKISEVSMPVIFLYSLQKLGV